MTPRTVARIGVAPRAAGPSIARPARPRPAPVNRPGAVDRRLTVSPTLGTPLNPVEGRPETDQPEPATPPSPLPMPVGGMSASSLLAGSSAGGTNGTPGALLALASSFAFIYWRSLQRQIVKIPTGLPLVVLTPPG
ncbi:MAG: hypothetical protein ACRDIY_19240 [Chloroflexota bacterium]